MDKYLQSCAAEIYIIIVTRELVGEQRVRPVRINRPHRRRHPADVGVRAGQWERVVMKSPADVGFADARREGVLGG